MARRLLAYTIDPNMTSLDQRGRAGAGFYDPGVPQPFIETLAFQTTPLRAALPRSRGSALCFLTRSDANRLRLKTLYSSILAVGGKLLLERRQFGKRRIGIDRTIAFPRGGAGRILPVRRPGVRTLVAAPFVTSTF